MNAIQNGVRLADSAIERIGVEVKSVDDVLLAMGATLEEQSVAVQGMNRHVQEVASISRSLVDHLEVARDSADEANRSAASTTEAMKRATDATGKVEQEVAAFLGKIAA